MENPNSAKVRYSVDGSYYDIPSDKVEDFERDTPQARQVYRVGEETYAIPLDKRDGFMAQYPDATFWNEPEQQQSVPVPQPEQPAPSLSSPQPEKQGFWARLGRNLTQAESSPQGVSMPEPATQPQTPKPSDLPENWEERSAEFDADYDYFSKVIDAKLAEKTDVYKQRSMEREKGMGRFLSGIVNAGQAEGGAITPQAREEIAAGGDPEADQLRAAAQLFESAKKTKDAAYNQKGVLGGLADSASVDTWDFGITDMKTAQQVYNLAKKIENNEELTENDNLLLEAMMQNAFANEYYSGQLKRGYKAGQVTGESLPFMLEFLMNPLAGGEKAASGGAIKVLEKNLAKRMAARAEKAAIRSAEKSAVRAALEKGGQVAMKALVRGGDDVLSAAGMAATTGSIRTLEDAYSRKTGDVQFHEDPDGGLVFDGFNGAEKDWWKAAAKAYGATTIEDFSEMFGNYFRPIGQTAKKGLYFINRKIGLGKVNDFIEGIGAKEWARAASEFLDRTDWNGPISEFGEEVVGGVMNALTVGDQTLSASDPNGVFNKDNMIDTFLGVALFGGVVSAMKTVGYSREAQRNSARRSDAIDEGERLFGEDWQRIQRQIDAADEQAVKQIVATALEPGSEYTPEQKKAIGEYAGIRMVQIGMEKGRQKRDDYVERGVEEGMNASTPEDINRLQIDAEYAQAKANRESESGEISGETEMEIEHSDAVRTGRRNSVRSQIVEQTGQPFWKSVEAETQQDVVDVITYADGREAYIISDDGAGTFATVDATGKKGFITEAQIEELTANNEAVRGSVPLDEYLDVKIGEQNTQAEQQRMAQDAANNLAALQQRVQEEGRINVGTPENEQMATVIDMLRDPAVGGVVVQVEGEPQPRTLSWKVVATAYGMPLEPKSNQEIVNERLDAEEEADNYNKGITHGAELAVPLGDEVVNYQFKNAEIVDGDVIIKAIDPVSEQEVDLTPEMVSNLPELIYGDVAAMPVSDVQGNPVPAATTESAPAPIFDDPIANSLGISSDYAYTTKRGEVVVDGSKLWAENPTLWAEWNDRNPNRVIPTKEYLEGKLKEIDSDVETARQNLEAEALGNQNPDVMEDLQDTLNRKEARQREVGSLIAKYNAAQETAAREAENAQREQETAEAAPAEQPAAPQTADEIVFSAQSAIETAKDGAEKAGVLQKMFDDLGTENTRVTTSEAILTDMRERGASERSIREVAAALQEAAATNQRVEGFFDPSSGTIYMLADQIGTAEDANRVQIHEEKHMENDQTGAPNEALRTGVTREEMAGAMRRRKKTRFYDNKPSITLADELLAVSAEIAEEEGVDAIPQSLRELGITNEEFINFVQNNIDYGRRNGQRRHIERRNPLQPATAQVSGGQDGRNREPEPAGVGRPGNRPDEGSRQGTRNGAAEPARAEEPGGVDRPQFSVVKGGEGAILADAVNKKNLIFKQGKPIDYAFTADNFYVYENPRYAGGYAYSNGEINVIQVIPIGNGESIAAIINEINNGTYRSAESIDRVAEDVRRRRGFDNRNSTDAGQERESPGRPVSLASSVQSGEETNVAGAEGRDNEGNPSDSQVSSERATSDGEIALTEAQRKALAFVNGTPVEEEGGIRPSVVGFDKLDEDGISVNDPALLAEYGLSDLTMTKKDGVITLNKIVAAERGNGAGTRFMNDLTAEADSRGWTLALTPDDSFGASSVNRLKDFYRRFGFKANRGRNTDFTINESMIRRPQVDQVLNNAGLAANSEEVRFSVRYSPSAEKANDVAKDIAKAMGVPLAKAKRWVKSETSLATLILDEHNSPYLNYEGDDRYTAIKKDSDYPQGTVDFNNICRKRIAFTQMYQRIQKAFPNTIITGQDLATIRQIMKDHDITVACGLCYVEDRRQLLGEIAKGFIEEMRGGFANYAQGSETKQKNAQKFRDLLGDDTKEDLSIYDLITLEGSDALAKEHPGIYAAFQAFNAARGQQAGNLFQGYAEYKREILNWSKTKVDSVNAKGGLRIFSYSDFEAHHLIDLVQIIQDCARKGVMIQGYTKVPAYARAVANTGIKLNRSLIPLGDTGIVDGRLAYDPVEGIDINDKDFLPDNDNIGNILIGINDEQIRLAMADPFVHYIIPYHSNQSGILRKMKQTGAWTNYKNEQTEKGENVGKHGVNIYTDVLAAAEAEGKPIKNEKQFVERFLQVCKEKGWTPRFARFLNTNEAGEYVYTPGYYKLLLDFKLFDENGRILPQKPVVAEFDDAFNQSILEAYVKDAQSDVDALPEEIYQEIIEKLGLAGRGSDIQFSVTAEQDAKYMQAVEAGDMERAQEMVLEAAKRAMPNTKVLDENGYPKVVYHQTNAKQFRNKETGQIWDELSWEERDEWDERDDWDEYWVEEDFNTFSRVNARTTNEVDGFFFAPEYDENHEYGDRTIPAFLNIENPAGSGDYNVDATYNDAGRNERIRLQNEGYDGIINEEDGAVYEYIAFNPSQIKSAEAVTYDDNGDVIPLSERFNPGNDDIRFSIRGVLGAQNDAVATANLDTAKEMETAGKDAKTIWLATGWEKGKDGKWRSEIPDGKAKAIPVGKRSLTVADVIDAPELFEAYPELKDYKVSLKKISGAGAFVPSKKEIELDADYNAPITIPEERQAEAKEYFNAHFMADPTKPATLRKDMEKKFGERRLDAEGMNTVMHELQHAIQSIEGFAKGGSERGQAQDYLSKAYKTRPEAVTFARAFSSKNSRERLLRFGRTRLADYITKNAGSITEGEGEATRRLEALRDYINGLDDWGYRNLVNEGARLWSNAQQIGKAEYPRLAGETEARNVEKRRGMSEEERRGTPLSETEDVAREEQVLRFSIREGEPPKKTGIGYKVFYQRDGKLYPPMVANPGGVDTPVGVWLDADAAPIAETSKTGRPKVKQGGKGTQGGSGTLAYRPGWHLGEIPYALQFNRVNPETGKKELFPKDFVWAEVEYSMDNDYQQEAEAEGMTENGKFRHSYAGLKRIPKDGFYRYRTNPNPETDPWIITGAMKVNRILSDEEVDNLVREAGREPQKRETSASPRFSISNRNQEVFVSNAEKAVEGIRMEKATPEQWLKMIEKGGGLKAGEDKWIGLSDWLKSQDKKSLTKQEVLDYIDQNRIRIEEVAYGDVERSYADAINSYRDEFAAIKADGKTSAEAWDEMIDRYGDDFEMAFDLDGDSITPVYDYDGELDDSAKYFLDQRRESDVRGIHTTRLNYTTEGLENKAEIALTVPTIEPWNESDRIHFGDAGEGRAVAWIRFGDTTTERGVGESPVRVGYVGAEPSDEAMRRAVEGILINWNDNESIMRHEDRENQFFVAKSMFENALNDNMPSYTEEQRELAERTLDALASLKQEDFETVYRGGKRVLVIDEIQSKRHQDAREQGYQIPIGGETIGEYAEDVENKDFVAPIYNKAGNKIGKMHQDPMAGWWVENNDGSFMSSTRNTEADALSSLVRHLGESGIPAAPFEKNWHELAMKRMLRYAAENGYDYVAWTTGDQQAERYSLSQYFTGVGIHQVSDKQKTLFLHRKGETTGGVMLNVNDDGTILRGSDDFVGQKLGDVVGKEIAVRILSTKMERGEKTELDDSAFSVGGEGMKGFYDDMLPRFMNKYGKKWGVKVEDITLPGLEQSARTMHAVPVTQEMKDSVMEGQPMFSVTGEEQENRAKQIEEAERNGLKGVIGEDGVSEIYREAYASIPKEELKPIVEKGLTEGGDIRKQLKIYLHNLAKKGTENDTTGLLFKLFDDIRFMASNPALTDADIRWMLFKETSDANEGDLLALAEERAMRNRWGVGLLPAQQLFQDATEKAAEEATQKVEDAEQKVEDTKVATASEAVFSEKERSLLNELRTLTKAMEAQKAYDKATVDGIVKFAREILKNGRVSTMTAREVSRLLSLVNASTGKSPKFIARYVNQLMDMLLDHIVKQEEDRFTKLVNVKAKKVNQSGVEAQGKLDIIGQAIIKAFRENMDSPVEDITKRIENVSDRILDDDDAIREEAKAIYSGLMLALQYKENIAENIEEFKDLDKEFKDVSVKLVDLIGRKAYDEFIRSSEEALRKNRMERIDMYRDLSQQLADIIKGGVERAAAFREADKKRVEDIHHDANRDMKGTPAREQLRDNRWQRFLNSDFVRFFTKSLATADQMFRLLGRKSATGEGYLYNRYIKNGVIPASERASRGLFEAMETLDKKAAEVFDKPGMKWSDIYSIERKMPGMMVTFLDGDEMVDHELTQGNMLYIYMANKMRDGKMKLRRMGISEEDVEAIKEQLDPRFVELADWMQDEFYVNLRNKYNAVHERMFGAPMAAIDDYVPLKILSNARYQDVDLGNQSQSELSSTITGSIIKRRKNSLALDILHTDAFSLAIEHIEKMEDWAAFAELRRDMNTLLSYKHFHNQILNMNTVYGSGETLWGNFMDVCSVLTGSYNPKVRRGDIDRIALNAAKGVTGAKIAFRVNTAIKQLLSFPAYFSDARPDYLMKSIAKTVLSVFRKGNVGSSWKWCMENLPLFEKRWKSRIAGDTRLLDTDSDWAIWKDNFVKAASRLGMTPNAAVDAMTVAIGAKAMYDTKKAQYIKDGYSEEKADEMAKRDAEILYNQTQQSSENAFVSPVQLDRTVWAVTMTTYRNSSMAYQRQLHDAIRNTARMMKPGYRARSIEFMKNQNMNNGLGEEEAQRAAERQYKRQWYRNFARVAIFGYGLQFLWKIGNDMWYLFFGDDDDEKNKILEDAALAELAGPVEGLVGGNVISEAWGKRAEKKNNDKYGIKSQTMFSSGGLAELPLESDMSRINQQMDYDEPRAINGIIDLLVQSGVGVNPQTLTDAVVALIDYANGDLTDATNIALGVMRIAQIPQSTIERFMVDQIDMDDPDKRKEQTNEMAKQYAAYKVLKNAPLTRWMYDEETIEKRLKSQEKAFKDAVKRRVALKESISGEEAPETPEDFYKDFENEMKSYQTDLNRAIRDKDTLTQQHLEAQPEYQQYVIWKKHQKGINKLTTSIEKTIDENLKKQWEQQRRDTIQTVIKELNENK